MTCPGIGITGITCLPIVCVTTCAHLHFTSDQSMIQEPKLPVGKFLEPTMTLVPNMQHFFLMLLKTLIGFDRKYAPTFLLSHCLKFHWRSEQHVIQSCLSKINYC